MLVDLYKSIYRAVCCLCVLFFVCSLMSETAAAVNTGNTDEAVMLGDEVNMRREPDMDSEIILKLSVGELVQVVEDQGDWTKIIYDKHVGYVRSDLLFYRTDKGRIAYALKDGVNIRGGPSVSAYVLQKTTAGDPMTVMQVVGEWYYVKYNGKEGFVQKDLVTVTSQEGKTDNSLLKFGMEGSEVLELQKELAQRNFLKDKYVTGVYGSITRDAVKEFQTAAKLESADGVAGEVTLTTIFDPSNTVKKAPEIPSKKEDFYGRVQMIDWWKGGNKLLKRPGGTCTVYDVKTGKSFKVRRTGGTNHVDGTPMTAADTAIMKSIYNGSWNHDRRSILVIIGSKVYAASLYGMPHGGDVQKNDNYPGMLCIHFTNSKTHGGNRVDSGHQSAIQYAYNKFMK